MKTGEDEETSSAGFTSGDRPVRSVLYCAFGETHFHQLGQENHAAGSHLSHLQGTKTSVIFLCLTIIDKRQKQSSSVMK